MGALANSDVCVLKFRVSEHYFLEIKSNGKVKVEPVNPALKPLKTYLHERDKISSYHIPKSKTYHKGLQPIKSHDPFITCQEHVIKGSCDFMGEIT